MRQRRNKRPTQERENEATRQQENLGTRQRGNGARENEGKKEQTTALTSRPGWSNWSNWSWLGFYWDYEYREKVDENFDKDVREHNKGLLLYSFCDLDKNT